MASQGSHNYDEWVTSYKLSYSTDGGKWKVFGKGDIPEVRTVITVLQCEFTSLRETAQSPFQGPPSSSLEIVTWLQFILCLRRISQSLGDFKKNKSRVGFMHGFFVNTNLTGKAFIRDFRFPVGSTATKLLSRYKTTKRITCLTFNSMFV